MSAGKTNAFEPRRHSPSAPSTSVPTASARRQCSRAVAHATEVTPAAASERATVVKLVTVSTARRSTSTVCAAAGAAAACSSERLAAPDESSSMWADGTAAAPNMRAAASSRSLQPPSTSTHCGGSAGRALRSTRASLTSASGTLSRRRRPVARMAPARRALQWWMTHGRSVRRMRTKSTRTV